jgi:hypothetical protein
LSLLVVFSACKKEEAPAPSAAPAPASREPGGATAARPPAAGKAPEAKPREEPLARPLTKEKVDAYVDYQRRMLAVYETSLKDMAALQGRVDAGVTGGAASSALLIIEKKARSEREAREATGLSEDDVNDIAEVVTAVIAQRQLARTLGYAEEVKRLEAMQARLTPEQQKELAPQVAEMRSRAQALEALTELRQAYGSANVDLVLAREEELTRGYQEMLRIFGSGSGGKP